MLGDGTGVKSLLLGSILALSMPFASPAHARSRHATTHPIHRTQHASAAHPARHREATTHGHHGRIHYAAAHHYGGISCVPYVRRVTGMDISGNANVWWAHAAGAYKRGTMPAQGSVLAFRANPRMRLGHVAVVSRVINAREIEVDQANWPGVGGGRGGISRNVRVVDVSPNNDWSAVRVNMGGSTYGSIYPTYGFIYNSPAHGSTRILTASAIPVPHMNPAPADLRAPGHRAPVPYAEVAEAPTHRGGIDLSVGGVALDAPSRNLR